MNDEEPIVWTASLAETPLGEIWAATGKAGLIALDLWGDRDRFLELVSRLREGKRLHNPRPLDAVFTQLAEYFAGSRRGFDLPVDWSVMSPFQREVLQEVHRIPYGELRTYSDIARRLGQPEAARAVGRANATNPIPIIIPCHRVLGADGRLHGYSAPGGLETKAWLLRHEGSWLI